MDDLISRQAAIDAVYKCSDIFAGDMPVMVVKADAYEALAQLPSAQPDIIRCRNCKWYGYYSCKLHGNSWMRDGNGYCDRAERRTDEPDR